MAANIYIPHKLINVINIFCLFVKIYFINLINVTYDIDMPHHVVQKYRIKMW